MYSPWFTMFWSRCMIYCAPMSIFSLPLRAELELRRVMLYLSYVLLGIRPLAFVAAREAYVWLFSVPMERVTAFVYVAEVLKKSVGS